ncbi:hypothetical protein [Streptomyces sp. NPDC048644]|uniref:hypothetical protein n=1 Tax=Streptomyces sp. NPDC048644 TaxID=3365582 RepID=UPI00371B8EEE
MPIDVPDTCDVPEGPHRQLLLALHQLYRDAGRPGIKRTSDTIKKRTDLPDTISHQGISKILHGTVVPQHWQKLESLVRQYLTWSVDQPHPDTAADTVRKILDLWHEATEQRTRKAPVPEEGGRQALEPSEEALTFLSAGVRKVEDADVIEGIVELMSINPSDSIRMLAQFGAIYNAAYETPHLAHLITEIQRYPTDAWHGHDPFAALLRGTTTRHEYGIHLIKLLYQQNNAAGVRAYLKAFALRTNPFHAAAFVVALAARGLDIAIDEFLRAIALHTPRPLAALTPADLKKLGRRREARTLAGLLSTHTPLLTGTAAKRAPLFSGSGSGYTLVL